MLSEADKASLLLDKKYFIEKGSIKDASYFQWLSSKGTNFSCYDEYMNGLSEQDAINNKIENIRIIIYALQRPITFISLGDVFDKLGDLFRHYYTNENLYENGALSKTRCKVDEMHPLKWLITRQLSTVLWYVGEIIGDWYPLLRTHAIVKKTKAIFAVYITCAIFNLSKVALIVLHLSRSAGGLYNEDGAFDNVKSSRFYAKYFYIQMTIIYASFFYDVSVYVVLRKCVFHKHKQQYQQGFLKKFKNLSEYRILVSALVSAIFLPIISVAFFVKLYYQKKDYWALDFSFEESRIMITSVPYYMIFIDQILLVRFRDESTANSNNNSNTYYNSSNSINKSNTNRSKYQLSTMNSYSQNDTLRTDNINLFDYSNSYNYNYKNNVDNDNKYYNNNNNNNSYNNHNKSKHQVSNIKILNHNDTIKNDNNIIDYYNNENYINNNNFDYSPNTFNRNNNSIKHSNSYNSKQYY
ncbi:hypothetical protein PIROE2DRAFT_5481 [Piromyces sp. E2]|nr:hypothetical protein PIROE2DRAFT_5481 [Piromyces sp. E2]|eukprot:OUM67105.1 hypothetical protein PIROE2DRAFT_5481 [Piromyces sp. E2]